MEKIDFISDVLRCNRKADEISIDELRNMYTYVLAHRDEFEQDVVEIAAYGRQNGLTPKTIAIVLSDCSDSMVKCPKCGAELSKSGICSNMLCDYKMC